MTYQDITEEVGDYQLIREINMQEKKWFTSTNNPEQLALTIRGMLALYIPFLLQLGTVFGWQWSESQLNEWLTLLSFVVASGMIVWGIIRKVLAWWKNQS